MRTPNILKEEELNMNALQLRHNVLDELEFEPSIDAAHIGVAVDKGAVTLTGHVATYAEKQAAIAAVGRVRGVHAIADNIEVRCPSDKRTSDDELAKRAIDILQWDTMIPRSSIQVIVHDGCMTLNGSVDWQYQKRHAEEDIRKLFGVHAVINNIEIKPSVQANDVKERIEQALKRHAGIESDAIRVSVPERNKVVLEGKVGSWAERYAVENAAWSAPGVKSVEDRMIGPFVYEENDDD
jgi:osmotically-inducible protein OsmY